MREIISITIVLSLIYTASANPPITSSNQSSLTVKATDDSSSVISDSTRDFQRALHINGNTLFGMNGGILLNYEQAIFRNYKGKGAFNLVVLAGPWYVGFGDWGTVLGVKTNYLFGKGDDHLEVALGAGVVAVPGLKSDQKFDLFAGPMATVGYRYSATGDRFMYRLGFGIPEGFYVGAGIRF